MKKVYKYLLLILPVLFLVSCGGKSEQDKEWEREQTEERAEESRRDSIASLISDDLCRKYAHEVIKKYTKSDFEVCRVERMEMNYFSTGLDVDCIGAFDFNIDRDKDTKWFTVSIEIDLEDNNKYKLKNIRIQNGDCTKTLRVYSSDKDKLVEPVWSSGDEFTIDGFKVKLGRCDRYAQCIYSASRLSRNTIMKIVMHDRMPMNSNVHFYTNRNTSEDYANFTYWHDQMVLFDFVADHTYEVKKSGSGWKFEVVM